MPQSDTNTASVNAALFFSENAYSPVPSPDGRFIAYVATGWGGFTFGTGRSNLVSDVGLANAAGKVLDAKFCPHMFLSGWKHDSSAVVCYRDGRYMVRTMSGAVAESGVIPGNEHGSVSERVSFLSDVGHTVWLEFNGPAATLRTKGEVLVQLNGNGDLLAASPDGRYIATMPSWRTGQLWIYDRVIGTWSELGFATVSPDENWNYIQPSWDPWLADSSGVVFFNRSELILSSPDGRNKRVLCKVDQPVGLPSASPDGRSVAYISFESRPMEFRPDLRFWSTAGVWLVPTVEGGTPRMLAAKTPDTSTGIRWRGNSELYFDQISENLLRMHARICKIHVD
jgi:WD40-like Beta Propeller Repeat